MNNLRLFIQRVEMERALYSFGPRAMEVETTTIVHVTDMYPIGI